MDKATRKWATAFLFSASALGEVTVTSSSIPVYLLKWGSASHPVNGYSIFYALG